MSKVEATVTGSNPSGVSLCVVVVISLKYEFHSTLIERVCVLVSWNVKRHRGSGCSLLHCHCYMMFVHRDFKLKSSLDEDLDMRMVKLGFCVSSCDCGVQCEHGRSWHRLCMLEWGLSAPFWSLCCPCGELSFLAPLSFFFLLQFCTRS